MTYINRKITPLLRHTLDRGKSILLLGARQTGKTTLIHESLKPDISYSFIQPAIRKRFETDPSMLAQEIEAEIQYKKFKSPVVNLDEVQRVPLILDVVQDLIDRKVARFILTGSSARKLKHGSTLNLLPGRVLLQHLDPLSLAEISFMLPDLKQLLLYGSLPGVFTEKSNEDKNADLSSYVMTYLEEEVRAEALVRNVAHFNKFLYLAAIESGNCINLNKLSQDVGVAHTTIATYFQILEDCLIVEKIEPLMQSASRRRLSKAPKFIFFDLGIRRLAAEEGAQLPVSILSHLFEQFVGLELIRAARFSKSHSRIRYWRDHAGPEVDYVIESDNTYLPVEVKWTEHPTEKDCRHLMFFLDEYPNAEKAYVVCQTPKRFLINKKITAIPWQEMIEIME